MKIAVLMTVYNRKAKTLRCLDSLQETARVHGGTVSLQVFLTDDGCTDGTASSIAERGYSIPIRILPGTGDLFWNGGMINSWKAALADGEHDGFLWLNDDTVVLPEFWEDLLKADAYCLEKFGKRGIYVGSTRDAKTGAFTYGGFVYTNKFTLKDQFMIPDGVSFQECEAGHGNITYVSSEVVKRMGIFTEKYHHGGSDHDYTYLAHKAGFPVLVLPHYSGECENDHPKDGGRKEFFALPLKERVKALNLHNTLLFNRRCFPWRYPVVLVTGYFKALFPKTYYNVYLRFRGVSL
jgi:GT2 family glycosyltransferase